ncbi:MAG TPA: glycosyltransferase family 39 protein [Flavipsychrobacter sp.]|nr:glycosyltransferase family 39 protein [Flavipsychrobacter sp.]
MRNDLLIFVGVFLLATGLFFHLRGEYKKAIISLFLAAVSFRIFAIYLDPFLHDWDEKFHALVAKHLINDPFTPILRPQSILPNNGIDWCCSNIWIHKQPLFLWQMALSMKIFGVNEFVMRYPSMLLGSLMVPITYRISNLLTNNKDISFSAAALLCVSYYSLDLISGRMGMEHNDVAFCFYILASIWAYLEFLREKSWKCAILIGVFAGCAILNKWLTGLLVYAGWSINLLMDIKEKDLKSQIQKLLVSLTVCAVIFLPWQFYINYRFPEQAKFERTFNLKHITEAVEGHNGGYDYYYNLLSGYLGEYVWVLFLAGFVILVFSKKLNRKAAIALTTIIIVPVVFFSFIVKTKMPSFVFILAPFAFICIAIAVYSITTIKLKTRIPYWLAICLCLVPVFNYEKLQQQFNNDDTYRSRKIYNTTVFKHLNKNLPKNIPVIMNTKDFEDVEVMFYVDNVICYNYSISESDMSILSNKGINIAVFKDRWGCIAENYVKNYKYKYLIPYQLH